MNKDLVSRKTATLSRVFSRLNLWPTVISTIRDQNEALNLLTASYLDLSRVATLLKHKPTIWLLMTPGTSVYHEILGDMRAICSSLSDDTVILINATDRITLAYDNEQVIPILFRNVGRVTMVYRLVIGKNSGWLLTLADEVRGLLAERGFTPGVSGKTLPSALAKVLPDNSPWNPVGFRED